jgi:hypothetical protein
MTSMQIRDEDLDSAEEKVVLVTGNLSNYLQRRLT